MSVKRHKTIQHEVHIDRDEFDALLASHIDEPSLRDPLALEVTLSGGLVIVGWTERPPKKSLTEGTNDG